MTKTFFSLAQMVMRGALVSICLVALFAKPGAAHEVQPTIADLTVAQDGAVTLDLRLNIEAFLAGVDLDTVADTDEDAAAEDYDALRALTPDALEALLPGLLETWNAYPLAAADGVPVVFEIASVTVPEDVDFELPRLTELSLASLLPVESATLTINWPDGSGALVLRQQGVDAPFTGYIDGGESATVQIAGGDAQTPMQAFASYIPVGFDHILPKGLDHILFVLGLFFLSTRWGPLLWQISAFTLAHTVTLALGALGWVSVPGSIVEPLIAASIVYVAIENVFRLGRLSRWRTLVIFGFGLLHGLGFASVLSDFGLPEAQFIPALIGFNVGVELGQLTVIGLAALLLWICVRLARRAALSEAEAAVRSYPVMFRAVSMPASLIIAAVGAYWCVERVFF